MRWLRYVVGCMWCLVIAGTAHSGFCEPIRNFVDQINPFEKLEIVGYFKNETALQLAGGWEKFMKEKNVAGIKANYDFTDTVSLFTEMKFWYDWAYHIEKDYKAVSSGGRNIELRRPSKYEDWLREVYLDIHTSRLDARLGRQQVVWGTTDGVRILDLVNPLDYREWTILDYSEMRIPLWMANIETEIIHNGFLQLLLIPDYQTNYSAPDGSPFTLRTVKLGEEGLASLPPWVDPVIINDYPARNFRNLKFGTRWRQVVEGGPLSGLDYTLNYLNTYDASPAVYIRTGVGPLLFPPWFGLTDFEMTRQAKNIQIFGGSFAKSITSGILGDFGKGWTIRGEFAYITGGAMNYGLDADIKGTIDVDQYNYAIGFDKTFWRNVSFSTQFIQLITRNTESYDKGQYTLLFGPTRGPLDPIENIVTMRLATDFLHQRIKPEVLVIYTDDNDYRISPKVGFEVNDNLVVTAGLHIFEGRPQHLNGQFDKNDQFFLETKYSW